MGSKDSKIGELRERIDGIDDELLALLEQRLKAASKIGEAKGASEPAQLYSPSREAEVIKRLTAAAEGLPAPAVERIFREIISTCLAAEGGITVGFLGPLGTFSHEATIGHFGGGARLAPLESVPEVFRALERGTCDYAVIPVENSTEGTVGQTLDLIMESTAEICGETYLRIRQHLLAKSGTELADIGRIYSHPMSLAQCRDWLQANLPGSERVGCISNAVAAERAAAATTTAAAVGSERAAEICGLTVLAADIEDDPRNRTRFWVVGGKTPQPTGDDKTSFVMGVRDGAGALYRLLAPMSECGVNMTRFESRPAPTGKLWDYVFFVDIEGHQNDTVIADMFGEMRAQAAFLRVMGSYPKAPGE